MTKLKKFFKIEKSSYQFEGTDVRAITTILNVIGVLTIGLVASWIGLAVALFDIIQDFRKGTHINIFLIHISLLILNSYFLGLLYNFF